MRIQNNITAMNTHRQYTINNDNVAKAAEKLSSGYRINRAADDAAGLAISEKMRSQIRGLNMATKNSQDAISLVQTAEGALQETHSMLQRMNELAVQAATGTNQEFDRVQAAKEFEQLKREINDVAEQTTFNNMKILDGSLSYEGYQRSAATSGVTVTTAEKTIIPGDKRGLQMDAISTTKGIDDVDAKTGTAASMTVTGAAGDDKTVDAAATATINVTYEDGGRSKTLSFTTGAATAGGQTLSALSGANGFDTADGKWNLKVDANGKFTISQKATKETNTTEIKATKVSITAPVGGNSTTWTVNAGASETNTDGVKGVTQVTGSAADATYKLKDSDIKEGTTITIGDVTYEFAKSAGDVADGNVFVQYADGDKAADAVTKLVAKAGPTGTDAPSLVAVAAGGNADELKLTATGNGKIGNADVADIYINVPGDANKEPHGGGVEKPAGYKYVHTVEVDTAKMKDGDIFEIKVGDATFKATFKEATHKTEAGESAAEKFAIELSDGGKDNGAELKWDAKGNALVIQSDEKAVSTKLLNPENKGTETTDPNAIRIQVGALENEQLAVSIDAMNTKGLGLDDFNLNTQNEAGMAITAVRDAVNKVSDQRATLGAMQNRLDHKIANLKVSSENLSAAESRIRDVDMASEMTNFTKNNILSQAATAMLAQANALPQNVLSLLG